MTDLLNNPFSNNPFDHEYGLESEAENDFEVSRPGKESFDSDDSNSDSGLSEPSQLDESQFIMKPAPFLQKRDTIPHILERVRYYKKLLAERQQMIEERKRVAKTTMAIIPKFQNYRAVKVCSNENGWVSFV